MESTFFEAPEYPLLDKFKNSAILFIKYSFALLAILMVLKLIEAGYGIISFKLSADAISIIIQSIIYELIFFIRSLPILFLIFLLLFFSVQDKLTLHHLTYALFLLYLVAEIVLMNYFFSTKTILGVEMYGANTIKMSVFYQPNIVFLILLVIAAGALWFGLEYALTIAFDDKVYAYCILALGVLFIYFGLSALPGEKEFKAKNAYNITVDKLAYFVEKSYEHFFDDEPEVDIYDSNYFD